MSRTFTCDLCGEHRWDNIPECDCTKKLTNEEIAAKRREAESRDYYADLAEQYYSDAAVQAEMDQFFGLREEKKA